MALNWVQHFFWEGCSWRVEENGVKIQTLALRTYEFAFFDYFWALSKSFLGLLHCLWLALNLGAPACAVKTASICQTKCSPLGVWSSSQHLGTESFLSQSNHIWIKLCFSVAIHGMLFGTANLFMSSAQWITVWKLLLQYKYSLPATVVFICYYFWVII